VFYFKEGKMDRTGSTQEGEEEFIQDFGGKLKKKKTSRKAQMLVRIILKWILDRTEW
jgi:hypothetical protein